MAAVKSKYDSANMFRLSQSIMPAARAVTRRPCCNASAAASLPTRNAAGVLSPMDNLNRYDDIARWLENR
jgi:hypothetical protein